MVDSFTATALDMYFSLSWSVIAAVLCSAPSSTVPLVRMDEELGVSRGESSGLPSRVWSIWRYTTAPVVPTSLSIDRIRSRATEFEFSREVGARDLTLCGQVTAGGQ